jgi:hypothetical protein
MHYLAGAERKGYGASPKMVRMTCRHAMPQGVENAVPSVYEPNPPLEGPMRRWDDQR